MDAVYSMIDSLQSNPDDTPVGKAIVAATHRLESGEENWAAIMNVCDLVNSSEHGPKDAVRSIRRHLQAHHDWSTISTMISIIEALSKNCGRRFHLQLTNRAFLREIRLIVEHVDSAEDPMPDDLRRRILAMIQCWAYVFRADKQFKPIKELYSDLLVRDIEFPDVKSSISMMPAQALEAENNHPDQRTELDSSQQKPFDSFKNKALNFLKSPFISSNDDESLTVSTDHTEYRAGTFLTSHQIAKLRSEISIVCEHVHILNQIIDSFQPENFNRNTADTSSPAVKYRKRDLELMDRLYDVCGEMHARILDIIGLVDEELLAQMLSIIDEMNNVFARYLDFRREYPKAENIQTKAEEKKNDIDTSQLLDLS